MIDNEGIAPALGRALTKRGYTSLTPVQTAVLESQMAGADALVSAQTGSGKTVAFGLALAPTLLQGEERFGRAAAPLALAIAPTRELALQVSRELEWLYEMTGATVATCVGGMDMRTERRVLERGAHIVVGTPGRLRDHITRNSLDVSALRAVVLDEADEMLDLGFKDDLEFILQAAPSERRTLMFSATVPASIAKLAKSYQRNAVRISTEAEQKQHADIEYRALAVTPNDRENAIINVLRFYEAKNALVFCNTRANVNHLTARFNNRGFTVVALSGELSQNERSHALQSLRDGRARVCIATDVAARGIDLPNLELVVHADLPTNPDTFLHRSGRTGRAGRKGVSALIVPGNARRKAERLLQAANIKAEWAAPPSADDVTRRDDERLLNNEAFAEAVRDEERDFITELLAKHGPELVAAAFVRQYRVGHSAPEELMDVGPVSAPRASERDPRFPRDESPRPSRDEFGPSVWLSLSAGRKAGAEPRWLIPMLCKLGGITKREIGAIKMMPDETFVQLSADCLNRFLAAVGPAKTLDRGMTMTVLSGTPDFNSAPRGERTFAEKKPYEGKRSDAPRDYAAKKPFGERKSFGDKKPFEDKKPWTAKPSEGYDASKPRKSFDKKSDDKRPARDPYADVPPAADFVKPPKKVAAIAGAPGTSKLSEAQKAARAEKKAKKKAKSNAG